MPPTNFATLMEQADSFFEGFAAVNGRKKTPEYNAKLKEALDLLNNVRGLPPTFHTAMILEALSTSDFPYLFGDVLDRQMLAGYRETPAEILQVAKARTLRDFRTARWFQITDGDQRLEAVLELADYDKSDRDEARFNIALTKYGRKFPISWETMINDDLGALNDTPQRFARAARRTEHYLTVSTFAVAAGPDTTLFTSGQGNAGTDALAIASLETGINAMADITDDGGEPIMNAPKYLVVPPALKLTALSILGSDQKIWAYRGTTDAGPTAYPVKNTVSDLKLQLIVDPYLPIISTSNPLSWYLFSDPNDVPSIGIARLAGHEAPELFIKSANQQRLGGGAASPMDGDFANDSIEYKVRHCFGTTQLLYRGCYGSKVS